MFRKMLVITTLIVAGESVFLLPFVIIRVFRPTFLDVFHLTNLELGMAFSTYGIIAFVSYFFGGPLADKYSVRKLMAIALLITAAGGFVYASIPRLYVLSALYGFWGLSTVLLFWAALIKATREWGGKDKQGRAYGILDGGRGLFAAIVASFSVLLFAYILPSDVTSATLENKKTALSVVIGCYVGIIIISAILVFIFVPIEKSASITPERQKLTLSGIKKIARLQTVWVQAVIVLCAYVGYKATDDFSLYARDAFAYDDVEAATIGTVSFWVRPIAALCAGWVGDYFTPSRMIAFSFLGLIISSQFIFLDLIPDNSFIYLVMVIISTSTFIYALRGLYFALMGEARIPLKFTGTAIGLISVIGFTPDIFMGPLMGYLIDSSPGALGHQHVFGVLSIFGFIGLIASMYFRKLGKSVSSIPDGLQSLDP